MRRSFKHRLGVQSMLRFSIPSLYDNVDVYWPDCERYFRGALVRRGHKTPFHFYIHYEDDDYQLTDLNAVRWHFSRGSYTSKNTCCNKKQQTLHRNDVFPGDLFKLLDKAQEIHRTTTRSDSSTIISGKVSKRRRQNPSRRARAIFAQDAIQKWVLQAETAGKSTNSDGMHPNSIIHDSSFSRPELGTVFGMEMDQKDALGPYRHVGATNYLSVTDRVGHAAQNTTQGVLEHIRQSFFAASKDLPDKAHWKKVLLQIYRQRISDSGLH